MKTPSWVTPAHLRHLIVMHWFMVVIGLSQIVWISSWIPECWTEGKKFEQKREARQKNPPKDQSEMNNRLAVIVLSQFENDYKQKAKSLSMLALFALMYSIYIAEKAIGFQKERKALLANIARQKKIN